MAALLAQMMRTPLLLSALIRHAAREAGDIEIVTRRVEGAVHRTTWHVLETRARRLAQALERLGCEPGDRIATLAWNGDRHLELYYGTSGSQLVCHTINPRLHDEQIAWIINDAADRVLCFDVTFLPLVERLMPRLASVRHLVAMTSSAHLPVSTTLPELLSQDEIIDAEDGDWQWPEFDENTASSLCYTSGTTGDPKGALYSHRSSILHAYAAAMADGMALCSADVVLPAVPMFHVNAWGLPYTAAMVGAKLVFPGPALDGKSLHDLCESEGVTFVAGVPTVWLGIVEHLRQPGARLSTLKRAVIGGAACPPGLLRTLIEDHGIEVRHAWGMTEMSPLGTINTAAARHAPVDENDRFARLAKQGRPLFGVELCVIDDDGRPLPRDGRSAGTLLARGPWVIERYAWRTESALVEVDGRSWFSTGDIATIDCDGFLHITDRSKDVIKSGGEWISSIGLENIAMAHPAVKEAAAVGYPHPKWDERPLLVVVLRPDADVSGEQIRSFFHGRVARWQVPDDVVFVDELPHTATGKVQKRVLRDRYRNHMCHSTSKGDTA